MPIFTQTLQRVDFSNPQDALKKMANHIKYLQETLEYTLYNLDSQNINEIDLEQTTIKDSASSSDIGSFIQYTGKNGERFAVGVDSKGRFVFEIDGQGGNQMMYLSDSGELSITNYTGLTVDGGEW